MTAGEMIIFHLVEKSPAVLYCQFKSIQVIFLNSTEFLEPPRERKSG